MTTDFRFKDTNAAYKIALEIPGDDPGDKETTRTISLSNLRPSLTAEDCNGIEERIQPLFEPTVKKMYLTITREVEEYEIV
jgi:hypothetical protein